MRQDYYGGNWYEDPDPPTFHQDPKPKYGLLLVILACIAFWISVGIGTYVIFF